MKEDITQIPSIPSFLKLKLVLPYPWAIKVSKNRIDCTSLSVTACIVGLYSGAMIHTTEYIESVFEVVLQEHVDNNIS